MPNRTDVDMIKFAVLIATITAKCDCRLYETDIKEIKSGVEDCIPAWVPTPDILPPATPHGLKQLVDPDLVIDLLKALKGDLKIEAIKAYRVLTGEGLKESKDTIERYTTDIHEKDREHDKTWNAAIDKAFALVRSTQSLPNWSIDTIVDDMYNLKRRI